MRKIAAIVILCAAFVVAGNLAVKAEETSTATSSLAQISEIKESGITFPIPELGNCESKDACKAYCDDTAHMAACIAFAESHGLMNKDEASRAKKFGEQLQNGEGPGGCASPKECRTFCSQVQNIEICTAFAKEHGIKDENTNRGEKLSAFLKSGGKMPGDCNSEETCKAYCSDFSHSEECFAFAKKTGIADGSAQPPAKFLELVKAGETPGGCTTKDQCEKYCTDTAHRDECIAFAEKAGFIEQSQGDKLREAGGKGPGGCDSEVACRDYCNDPSHHEECFKFGVERGFIKPEEAQNAREGLVQVRSGLENAPNEVKACLASNVGPNILDDIQSGKLVPGPDIGERVRSCFEKFGQTGNTKEILKGAPPAVTSCLKAKLGSSTLQSISSGKEMGTAELADTFRICAQVMHLEEGSSSLGMMKEAKEHIPSVSPRDRLRNFLKSAPSDILPCLREKLGSDLDKIQAGENVPQIDTSQIKSCFDEFHPKMMEERNSSTRAVLPNMPPAVAACLKEKLGADFNFFQSGTEPTADMKAKMSACFGQFGGTTSAGSVGAGAGNSNVPQPRAMPIQPAIGNCLKNVLGVDSPEMINTSELSADVKIKLQNCIQEQLQNNQNFQGIRLPLPPNGGSSTLNPYPNQYDQYPPQTPTSSSDQQLPPPPLPPTGGNTFNIFQWLVKFLFGS